MKAASVKQLKDELKHKSPKELTELVLRLSKFKKENKELLTYLLFEADNEFEYVAIVKEEVVEQFAEINNYSFYTIKKAVRKILRNLKKHIRYSGKKETEVELLVHFCECLINYSPRIKSSHTMMNIFDKQLEIAGKKIKYLHEDLQHDYTREIERVMELA
ncbi:MAG: hypothetical protein MK078_09520 [Crocinitomicaceae bacterium]|nr:hypothetical protein [Crocinitomicaceae bacterium]